MMNVKDSHDIALTLQHKVEGFDEVERAFVHVDYEHRDEPEHKVSSHHAISTRTYSMTLV